MLQTDYGNPVFKLATVYRFCQQRTRQEKPQKSRINVIKMPSIPGKYQHYKNENIDDYFIAVGVPLLARKMMSLSSPLMEITLENDTMTIKNSSLMRTTSYTFNLGEEYDENMPSTVIKSVTTIVNENEMVTTSVIPETGEKCGRHYSFTDDECVVTLTHDKANTPGKRYFRRVK